MFLFDDVEEINVPEKNSTIKKPSTNLNKEPEDVMFLFDDIEEVNGRAKNSTIQQPRSTNLIKEPEGGKVVVNDVEETKELITNPTVERPGNTEMIEEPKEKTILSNDIEEVKETVTSSIVEGAGNTEINKEPEEVMALCDDVEAPTQEPIQENSSQDHLNPFENQEVYGTALEFYFRYEKLIISYKLFKEHYQTTKRLTDYRDSSSIRLPKASSLRNYVPEQFGLELQKFIERHSEKDQKILIGIINDHDFSFLAQDYREKLRRGDYKAWLGYYLKVALSAYQEHMSYYDELPANLNDPDILEILEVPEEPEESDVSDVLQSDNEDVDDILVETGNAEMSLQIEENEEEKAVEEPQEESKHQMIEIMKNSQGSTKQGTGANKYVVDSRTRKECEDNLAFQIIDDYFLTVLILQCCKDSIEDDEKYACLKSLCISPETELKVISLLLAVLEHPTYDFSAVLCGKSFVRIAPHSVETSLKLLKLLISFTTEKNFIPNELLEKYKPSLIKSSLQKEGTQTSLRSRVAFSVLDRIILLLNTTEISKNNKYVSEIIGYASKAFNPQQIEIVSAATTLTIDQLLQKSKTTISTDSVRTVVEVCAMHGDSYPALSKLLMELLQFQRAQVQSLELVFEVCLEKLNGLNGQIEAGLTKLKQVPNLEQKARLAVQLTSGLKPLSTLFKEMTNYLWLKVMGKETIKKIKPENIEKQKLKEIKRAKFGKKIEPLIEEMLTSQTALEFVFNIFEILGRYSMHFSKDTEEQYNVDNLFPMISVLSSLYVFDTMSKQIKAAPEIHASQDNEPKSIDSLPDLGAMPKLSKFISRDVETAGSRTITLARSVSQIKRQPHSANLTEIYHECLYNNKDIINYIVRKVDPLEIATPSLSSFLKKFSYIVDLSIKEIIAK